METPYVLNENELISDDYKSREWHIRDIYYATLLLSVHVLCVFAPSTFNWTAAWLTIVLGVLTGLFGIALSYHRNLTHSSFKLPKYLEYLFAYFGLHALQGDPMYWVSVHRYHHKSTDKHLDPHSPIEGFWFSYMNWMFDYCYLVHKGKIYGNVGDLMKQRYYRFLRKTLVFHYYLLATILYTFGGFPFVVWGMGVRIVVVYHITSLLATVCHIWGHQAWNTGDLSRNNWFIALITFGEGWHNNHHAFEYSARAGMEWWQIDITWYVIKLLEYFGLATNVKEPSEIHKQKMRFKKCNGSDKTST
ncbi:Acyl-coa 5-desaturase al21 [Thalictrum thalictroides]|uniref:Acyl-coa 5-desaturase al21 n=1 Tax=Thalictrum thalictroides TaxID=46969 RepID=A0A7J6WPK8_THATH|nr:Acyl-coa 5-desaturase al21 [Thalictrum thalictroides]